MMTERKHKSRKAAMARADRAFSLYIRLRDSREYGFKYFLCPTCRRVLSVQMADCSHFFSRRMMATRFDPDNCVAECRYDNRFNGGHLLRLRPYMVRRLGRDGYAALERRSREKRKWTVAELDELVAYYKALSACLVDGMEGGGVWT